MELTNKFTAHVHRRDRVDAAIDSWRWCDWTHWCLFYQFALYVSCHQMWLQLPIDSWWSKRHHLLQPIDTAQWGATCSAFGCVFFLFSCEFIACTKWQSHTSVAHTARPRYARDDKVADLWLLLSENTLQRRCVSVMICACGIQIMSKGVEQNAEGRYMLYIKKRPLSVDNSGFQFSKF